MTVVWKKKKRDSKRKREKNGNNLGETQALSVKILLDNDYIDCIEWSIVDDIKGVFTNLTSESKKLQFYWYDMRLLLKLLLRYINRATVMPPGTSRKELAWEDVIL